VTSDLEERVEALEQELKAERESHLRALEDAARQAAREPERRRDAEERLEQVTLQPSDDEGVRVAALKALVAAREERIERLVLDLEGAQGEVPALEAEIVVLRTELRNARRQLDQQAVSVQAMAAQLEHDKLLLQRTREALSDVTAKTAESSDAAKD
jgi:hypothetical protein